MGDKGQSCGREGTIERTGRARRYREAVCITRRGKPVARITAVDAPRKRIDAAALQSVTDAMPVQPESAREVYPSDAR